ncbi:AsmA family protein [Pontibaca methylaminivorans]|uniref:AsmA family protein n=1 Tax=Pontibaca methylaminivorans TaxID=515897 RepID=UPI002FD972E9
MRLLFRLIGALLVAVVLLGAGLVALPFVLPGEKVARIAADQIRARTGRDLSFAGDVSFTYWPVLGVTTGPVRFANADWAGAEPMLSADALTLGLSAPDLLRGMVRITELTAARPVLNLATREDGRGNWEFGAERSADAAESTPSASGGGGAVALPVLEKLNLADARITWAPTGGERVVLDGTDLALDWPDQSGPAQIRAVLHPHGTMVSLKGQIGRFDRFQTGEETPLALQAETADGTIGFDGRARMSGAAAGHLSIDARDTARMLAALAGEGVELPRMLGDSARISADVSYHPEGRIGLERIVADLGGTSLSGALDVALGVRPRIKGQIATGVLDLRGLGGGGGDSADTGRKDKARGWSQDRIDAGALSLVDADLDLSAEGIRTDTTDIGRLRGRLALENARAVLDIAEAQVFDGTVTGQLVANNRSGFSLRADVTASRIDMQKALRDLAGVKRLSGRGEARVEVLASGSSEAALMNSLSGSGSIAMAEGVISGFDLDRLTRGGDPGSGTTVFDSLNATFDIRDGDLFNDDLELNLPNYRTEGEGRIGIGARDLDYVITPIALRANAGEGLRIPIRFKGSWDDPKIRPDVKSVIEQGTGVSREELEAKAKDKLREKLEKELRMQPGDDRDPVDALKDRLEDEARKGLLKLFGDR